MRARMLSLAALAVAGAGLGLGQTAAAQPLPAESSSAVHAGAGSAGLRVDFDGNGIADLAVGVPLEDVGAVVNAGAVHVLYGAGAGLSANGDQFISQDTGGVQGVAEAGDQFGFSVVAANFNGDAFTDLAIGVPFEDGAVANEGGVHVLYGSPGGLTANADEFYTQNTPGILETSEVGDQFGLALEAGDFGRSGQADLAVGVPNEDVAGLADAGIVQTIYGTVNGLTAVGNQTLRRGAGGIGGAAGAGDGFGAVLTTANFGLSAHKDLAVGLPNDDVTGVVNAGSVHVIYGSATGLTGTADFQLTQDTAGVADVAENQDHFGETLASANLGRSAQADLAIGVPAEDHSARGNAGAVHVLYGTAAGISTANSALFTQTTAGVNGVADAFDRFGDSLAAADFGRGAEADLAIGVPFEDAPGAIDAGAVQVLYGSVTGATAAGDQYWDQNTAGISDSAETGDRFGETLTAAHFGFTSDADLAIGVPFENVGATVDAGGVQTIYGTAAGLNSFGNTLITQDTAGVLDAAEGSDRFGSALGAKKG